MAKSLYLYTDPFVVDDTVGSRAQYILDFMTEDDRKDQDSVRSLLIQFAIAHDMVKPNEGELTPGLEANMGSWIYQVNWMNFRSLVDITEYANLMRSLQSVGGDPLNRLIDLHSRLGVLYDHILLNTMAHRTMVSIALIPYEVVEGNEEITWSRIHKETPFIWVLIMLQACIRSIVKPLK